MSSTRLTMIYFVFTTVTYLLPTREYGDIQRLSINDSNHSNSPLGSLLHHPAGASWTPASSLASLAPSTRKSPRPCTTARRTRTRPFQLTTYKDAAKAAAAVALAPRGAVPARINVAGDVKTLGEVVAAYEQARGKTVPIVRLGSLEELTNEIAKRQRDEPDNVFSWLPMCYYRAMLDGTAEMPDINSWPALPPNRTTVEEYLKEDTSF